MFAHVSYFFLIFSRDGKLWAKIYLTKRTISWCTHHLKGLSHKISKFIWWSKNFYFIDYRTIFQIWWHGLFKGTISRKLSPMLLYIVWKLSLWGLSGNLQKWFLLKGQWVNYIQSSQLFMNICLWKCRISPKYGVWHTADFERGGFSSKACVDFAVQHTFKVKCAKNW